MAGIQRILVPTDFSPASEIALRYAIDLADRVARTFTCCTSSMTSSIAAENPDGDAMPAPPEVRRAVNPGSLGSTEDSAARSSPLAAGSPAKWGVAGRLASSRAATSRGSDVDGEVALTDGARSHNWSSEASPSG